MIQTPLRPRNRNDFRIAIICALPVEAEMVHSILDKDWADEDVNFGQAEADQNAYTTGVIGRHNVVLAYMPGMGGTNAAAVATALRSSYNRIEVAFVVGICGVTPKHPVTQEEIVLGDCIISTTLIQYDYGRQYPGLFTRKSGMEDNLGGTNPGIKSQIAKLQTTRNVLSSKLVQHLEALQRNVSQITYPGCDEDRLFNGSYPHAHHNAIKTCDKCIADIGICGKDCETLKCEESELVKRDRLKDTQFTIHPQIHFGRYGSANTVLRSGTDRERLVTSEEIVAFEMEGAGVWNNLPTILVKSACDYADSHKNKRWQRYAAATAAAALKSILGSWRITDVVHEQDSTTRIAINVPDYAVAHFVPRKDILNELDGWLRDELRQERMVLRGMGGAGKSQLALECCKRAVVSNQYTAILWIDASSVFAVQQSFKAIISELKGQEFISVDAKENVRLVTIALQERQREKRNGKWLAIFDNFDSPGEFPNNSITEYIPAAQNAKVLFTSRDADSERLGRYIRVLGMTEQESLDLLFKRSFRDSEREVGIRVAAELGNLALALDQAEAYIRARGLSLQDFLRHFGQRKKVILQEIPQHWEYRRGNTKQNMLSAFTTWELSFELISGSAETKQSKEHFLTLCAFFDASSISKEYFESYFKDRGANKNWMEIFKNGANWDEFLFDDLICEFGKLSLLQIEEYHDGVSFSFHPLIRDWLKLRKTEHQQQEIALEFVELLVSQCDAVDFESLEHVKQQRFLNNVVSCLQGDTRLEQLLPHAESLVHFAHALGEICELGGYCNEAEALYRKVLASAQERLEAKHPSAMKMVGALASVCRKKGNHDEAEILYRQVLAGSKERLGAQHPVTLHYMHDLAVVYTEKGMYKEAEESFKQALVGRQKVLHVGHFTTLITVLDLASLYITERRYDEAEELLEPALASLEKKPGHEHPYTLKARNDLGNIYHNKGRYDEAEELYRQVLAVDKKLGFKNIDTLNTMGCLAVLYESKGRYNEAEELWNQLLAGNQEIFGPEHPRTLKAVRVLADLHDKKNHQPDQRQPKIAGRQEIAQVKSFNNKLASSGEMD